MHILSLASSSLCQQHRDTRLCNYCLSTYTYNVTQNSMREEWGRRLIFESREEKCCNGSGGCIVLCQFMRFSNTRGQHLRGHANEEAIGKGKVIT